MVTNQLTRLGLGLFLCFFMFVGFLSFIGGVSIGRTIRPFSKTAA